MSAAPRERLSKSFVIGFTAEEYALMLDLMASDGIEPAAAVLEALRHPTDHAKVLIDPSR